MKDLGDLKEESFDVVYIGDVYGNPFKGVEFLSDVFIFENEYYLKIYKKNGTIVNYNDIVECLKAIKPYKDKALERYKKFNFSYEVF